MEPTVRWLSLTACVLNTSRRAIHRRISRQRNRLAIALWKYTWHRILEDMPGEQAQLHKQSLHDSYDMIISIRLANVTSNMVLAQSS